MNDKNNNKIGFEKINFALSYPFPRPLGDFVFIDGHTYEIDRANGPEVTGWLSKGEALSDIVSISEKMITDLSQLIPVVATGSNGSPVQLRRKFSQFENVFIPCLKVRLQDYISAYGREIGAYASIPASLESEKGAQTHLFVNFLTPEIFEAMNLTEGLGNDYELIKVSGFDRQEVYDLNTVEVFGYQMCNGRFDIRLDSFETENSALPPANQWQAQKHALEILGEDIPVEEFITQNLTDHALRARRSRVLSGS